MTGQREAIRVLLVDDQVDFAELAATFLERVDERIGVATVESAAEGLEYLRSNEVDWSRLQQLLENLFRNAVEHGSTRPGSPARQDAVEHGSTSPRSNTHEDAVEHGGEDVTVTLGDLPDGFYVEDDGAGFDDEAGEQVFEAGYSTSAEGSGFGLNIVEQVASAHGWAVRARTGEAGGARFEFTGVEFVE